MTKGWSGGGRKKANAPVCCRNNFSREAVGTNHHSVFRQVLFFFLKCAHNLVNFFFEALFWGLIILRSGTARLCLGEKHTMIMGGGCGVVVSQWRVESSR